MGAIGMTIAGDTACRRDALRDCRRGAARLAQRAREDLHRSAGHKGGGTQHPPFLPTPIP